MSRSRITFFLTILILIVVIWIFAQDSTSTISFYENDPNNPYIFYYSNVYHAFIFERADGTDSRLVAQNLLPEHDNIVRHVQWSPSGKFVAWISSYFAGPGHAPDSAWVAAVDGSSAFQIGESTDSIMYLEWSPNEDLLFAGHNQWNLIHSQATYEIIDPQTGEAVVSLQNQLPDRYEYYGSPTSTISTWLPDGSGVYFNHGVWADTFTLMHLDGTLEQYSFDSTFARLLDSHQGRLVYVDYVQNNGQSEIQVTLHDIISGRKISLDSYSYDDEPFVDPYMLDYNLHWSPALSTAFVQVVQCVESEYGPGISCSTHPDNIIKENILDWETGEQRILEEYSDFRDCNGYRYEPLLRWSADGQHAIVSRGDNNHIEHFDIANLTFTSLETYNSDNYNCSSWAFNQAGDGILFYGDNRLALEYDFNTHAVTEFSHDAAWNGWISASNFSPSGRYFFQPANEYQIYDTQSDEHIQWARPSVTSNAGPLTDVTWNEEETWFFSGTNTQVTDSCCNSRAIMIHSIDGSIRRELTLCYNVATCSGFAPDRVIQYLTAGQGESYTPAPDFELIHDNDAHSVAWSLDDTQIAVLAGTNLYIWSLVESVPQIVEIYPLEIDGYGGASSVAMSWVADNQVIIDTREEWLIFDLDTKNVVTEDIDWNARDDAGFSIRNASFELIEQADKSYLIRDIQTGDQLAVVPATPYRWRLLWLNDDNAVAFVQYPSDQYLWDGTTLYRMTDSNSAYSADYSSEAQLFVAGDAYRPMQIWDLQTGDRLPELNTGGWQARFDSTGTRLAVAGSQIVTIWNLSEYRQ